MYVILNDRSNGSLIRSEVFDRFDVRCHRSLESIRICAGLVDLSERKTEGFHIESMNGRSILPLLIECNEILIHNRFEILTPEAATHHPHLKSVADCGANSSRLAETTRLLDQRLVTNLRAPFGSQLETESSLQCLIYVELRLQVSCLGEYTGCHRCHRHRSPEELSLAKYHHGRSKGSLLTRACCTNRKET